MCGRVLLPGGGGKDTRGAVGGARFGVLRLGEGRVPSQGYVGRGVWFSLSTLGIEELVNFGRQ